jgi:hypothetical protein
MLSLALGVLSGAKTALLLLASKENEIDLKHIKTMAEVPPCPFLRMAILAPLLEAQAVIRAGEISRSKIKLQNEIRLPWYRRKRLNLRSIVHNSFLAASGCNVGIPKRWPFAGWATNWL